MAVLPPPQVVDINVAEAQRAVDSEESGEEDPSTLVQGAALSLSLT